MKVSVYEKGDALAVYSLAEARPRTGSCEGAKGKKQSKPHLRLRDTPVQISVPPTTAVVGELSMVNRFKEWRLRIKPTANLVRYKGLVSCAQNAQGTLRTQKTIDIPCGGGFDRVHMLNDSFKPHFPHCKGAVLVHTRKYCTTGGRIPPRAQ